MTYPSSEPASWAISNMSEDELAAWLDWGRSRSQFGKAVLLSIKLTLNDGAYRRELAKHALEMHELRLRQTAVGS